MKQLLMARYPTHNHTMNFSFNVCCYYRSFFTHLQSDTKSFVDPHKLWYSVNEILWGTTYSSRAKFVNPYHTFSPLSGTMLQLTACIKSQPCRHQCTSIYVCIPLILQSCFPWLRFCQTHRERFIKQNSLPGNFSITTIPTQLSSCGTIVPIVGVAVSS